MSLDPYSIAAYSPTEAARYLKMSVSTVRAWIKGYKYSTKSGKKEFKKVIETAENNYLSFRNLIEIFMLNSIRKKYEVSLSKVREAIVVLKEEYHFSNPLIDAELYTDRSEIMFEKFGNLLNLNRNDQIEMKELIERCLTRLDRDENGVIRKFYPVYDGKCDNDSKEIEIDPKIQFGKPCLRDTGIPTQIIFSRYSAGESPQEIAADYDCDIYKINDAIHYEEYIREKVA